MHQARLLGQYEIRLDGQPVIIPSRPTQSLFAFLLLNPNKSHRREKLAGLFWPDATESNARSNLRHALWRIRKAFGPGVNARMESDDLVVTYHPQPGDQLDVDSFEACPEEEGSIETLLLALSAYGGDLLPGFYEEWVMLERERLQAVFERKLGRLLERLLAERRWNEVLKWDEQWVATGGIPEPAYRTFVLATDREKLAREVENQLPGTGGYIPPGLPGHSPDIGLPYDPQEAQRILAKAGYPQGRGFPPVNLLLNLVGFEKGDNLVFAFLQEMWQENLGVTLQKCLNESETMGFETRQDFHLFFIGWLADYPDPASFLQTNFLIKQSHWQNPIFEALIEEGRHTLDQNQRLDLYRQADRVLTEEAVVLPLFYGHLYELGQPWTKNLAGSSIYSPQWKDVTLMPH